MLATAIIVFREVLEAALIVSIILVATRGVAGRRRWIGGGIIAGLVVACLLAGFAGQVSDLAEGLGQEYLNAAILLAAVLMLAWHNVWMAQHARELSAQMKSVGQQVVAGTKPMHVLSIVVALAVMREGSEVVLFLYGMGAASDNTGPLLMGGLAGLGAGMLAGAALYFGMLRIPVRRLFQVTGWMILLLAAGLASEAVRYLVQAGALPTLSNGPLWDSGSLISAQSLLGQTLHTLVGYTPRPLGIQLAVWLLTLLIIGGLMFRSRMSHAKAALPIALVCAGLFTAGMLVSPSARAEDVVYSPIVEKGEFELEWRAHRDEGGEQEHKWEVGYGFTDRWASSVFVETKSGHGENFKAKSIAWENIFQLTEQGRFWLDAGLYVEYEHSLLNGGHDKLETKLLLEKTAGHFVHRANIIFEKEVDGINPDGVELEYAWQSLYRIQPAFNLGLEAYGKFGELSGFTPAAMQTHSIGPVVSGGVRLSPRWKLGYELGYQTGLTSVTPERVRALLELETRF